MEKPLNLQEKVLVFLITYFICYPSTYKSEYHVSQNWNRVPKMSRDYVTWHLSIKSHDLRNCRKGYVTFKIFTSEVKYIINPSNLCISIFLKMSRDYILYEGLHIYFTDAEYFPERKRRQLTVGWHDHFIGKSDSVRSTVRLRHIRSSTYMSLMKFLSIFV